MKTLLLPLLVSTAMWGYGENALYLAPHPGAGGGKPASAHGGHGHGKETRFAAMNLEGNATAKLILPDLTVRPLVLHRNTLSLPKPSVGGYYALVLESKTPERTQSAVRYLSQFGRPAKVSPTRLTALPKSPLEIVPNPLHREHDRYTASKTYRFTVMFENHPLPNASVRFETNQNTAKEYRTDPQGGVSLELPDDFQNVKVGRSENLPGEFLLTVEHRSTQSDYVSTLSMPYYVNPNDYWQSQKLGAGTMLLGFLGGLFLYRRTKGVNHG